LLLIFNIPFCSLCRIQSIEILFYPKPLFYTNLQNEYLKNNFHIYAQIQDTSVILLSNLEIEHFNDVLFSFFLNLNEL